MELTENEKQKIRQNESENNVYKVQLDKFFSNQMQTHEIINVCSTPNILKIFNSGARKVVLSQKDLQNAVSEAELGNKSHREGHDIAKSEIYKLPESIRSPILMLKGNNRNSNSVVMLTEMVNKKGENVFVPIALDRQKGKISNISTLYGKKNLSQYLSDHLSDILAINTKKADMLANIGVQFPKSMYDTVVCFDNSIAYSTANVKYISENSQNISEEEKFPSGDERNDNMAETTQQELLDRIAALEKKVSAMTAEQQNLKEQINTVNQFISSITESQNFEQSMSTIESMGKQVLDCGKAEFWCYDGAENKYFTNDENRGGRDWQIAKENMRIAADTKEAYIADGEAYIPIISNDKVAGILVASEKDGAFDRTSLEKFAPNGQIANTIDLSLKKEFEHQGRITDELTRLKNRQGAKEYAVNTMAHNVNVEKDMCLIMCDIDHFKSINDTYGHDAGDTVLKNVAGILQSGTRQGADAAFRWGGEEMVCVLNCDYDHAMDIAERLRQQIESTTHLVYNADKQPVNVSVTISMGVYQVKPDKEITQENAFSFFESQLKFADELAYTAKETGRNKVVGENDIMQEKNAEKENYSIFFIDNGIEKKYFRDDNTDVNALVQRLADGNLTYPEISKNCTEISDLGFAELEQNEKNPPAFCAEINLSTKDIVGDEKPIDITVWDNEKTATISLDEAIQSLKENGTVNLDYQKFAENSDTVELASEYLDAAQHLNDVYDDFLYRRDIFNDEHIKFIDEHGELPDNLDSAENRAAVTEYINTQLDSGNITEAQRESLKNLQQEIRNFEEPLFYQEVEKITEWCEEAQEKAAERLNEHENQNFER